MPEIKKRNSTPDGNEIPAAVASTEPAEEKERRRFGRKEAAPARKADPNILNANSPFSVTEAYKALRTNVIFALPDEGGKIIGVTSGSKGDGKSSSLLNMAISFAELGKRCIVVDCDLRLPTVASKLGIKNAPGLTDVIVGSVEPVDAIRSYRDNLDVLPSGTIPRDSTGLISSARMTGFLNRLKEIYDYVFIDFPPVTTVTDAAILSSTVDGYLLVVRHEDTEFKAVSEMVKLLRIADARILGFIYNDAPTDGKKYYKYKYYK